MLSKIFSGSVHGINGTQITVEVDIAPGMPSLSTVGLPDTAIREARDRVIAAVRNSGFDFPIRKITVNLAPADVKKEGAAFDLPIAIGILSASQVVHDQHLLDWCIVGELALDGSLRPVKGILPITIEARAKKMKGIICPHWNQAEAEVIGGIHVVGMRSLKEVVDFLNQEKIIVANTVSAPAEIFSSEDKSEIDFSDVKGQLFAKRALEIACAGGHNVLMIGPPGSGKTMLSKRVGTILPLLEFEESIETTKIHSVAGLLSRETGLVRRRPFRSPHHTMSHIALIGGGQNPRPGEVSLAHNGVLFLDELPEFHRNVLEVLRQPLEAREVVIARAKETLMFPANFMLIAAMNPCPCGFSGHPSRECVCTSYQIQKYMAKISGPLLDRIDIHMEVPALKIDELTGDGPTVENSEKIRARIIAARSIQKQRFAESKILTNSLMNAKQTKKFCQLSDESRQLLIDAVDRLSLSARAYDRILKVARTIADLENSAEIQNPHIAESIQFRTLDRTRN